MACSALLWPESAADNMYSLDLSAVYSVAYLVEGSGPRAAPTAPTPPSLATAPETVVRDVVSVVAALGFYAMQVSTAVANRFFGWLDTAVQTNAVFKARVLMAILTVPRSARPGAAAPLLTSTTTASAILSPHLQPTVLPMVARTLAARPYTPLMLLAADMFWDPVMPGVLSAMMAAPPHVRDPALAALISGSVAATTSAAATPIAAAAIAASTNGTTVTPRYYQSLLDWLVTYQLGPQFNPATDLPPFTAANKVASRVPAAHRKMAVQLAALDTVAAMATRDRGWAARNLDAVGALAATGLARSAKAAAAARMVLDATAPTTGATSGTLGAAQVVSDRWISLALDLSATLVTPHAAVTWAEHLARVLERSAATVAGGLGGVSDKALRALAAETSPLWRLRASFAAVGAVNDAVDRVAAATLSVACSTASASASSRPTVNNDGTAGGNYTNGFAPHVSDLAQEDDDDNANHDPLDALRDLLVHYEVVSDDASVLVSSTRVGGAASNTLPPALAGDNCKLARFVRVIGRVVELDALDVVPVRSASRTRVHPPTQLPGGPVRPPPPSSSTTTSLLDLLAAAAMDALALAYANNSHGLSVLASALTQLLALPRRWNHQSVAAVAGVAATQWLPVRLRKVALATLAESAAAAAISPDTLAVAITGVLGHRTPAPVLCDLLALVLTCVPDEAIAELSDEACEMVILQAVAETVESYDDDGQQQQQQWMRLASRIPRAVPTHSLDQFKRCVMAAPHAGQFHAQHVHRLLASTGRALPIADLQRLFASTAVGLTMPAHLWRSREALETYAAWEAARFCVLVRFKTPVGSASATLMAIETLVHRKQTMAVRILDAIDRWLLVADAGSAAASASSGLLPPPLPPAAAKYLTDNGATMAEWTARVRRAAVRAATQAGWRVSAVAHAMALAAAPSRKHATRVDVGVAARHLAALGVPDLVDGFSSVFGSDLDRSRALACGAVETFPADEDEGGGTGREDAVTVIGGGGASSLGSSTNNATAATPGISLATAYLVMSDYRAMDQFYAEHVLHGEDQGMDAMHAEMLEQVLSIFFFCLFMSRIFILVKKKKID
ncbi:hypothetical protein BC828DRAFT_241139 [Blastocladiella britannica]|nr:hypothetical protein BC828DRAFT_241139 [Blastocladiella britannica]